MGYLNCKCKIRAYFTKMLVCLTSSVLVCLRELTHFDALLATKQENQHLSEQWLIHSLFIEGYENWIKTVRAQRSPEPLLLLKTMSMSDIPPCPLDTIAQYSARCLLNSSPAHSQMEVLKDQNKIPLREMISSWIHLGLSIFTLQRSCDEWGSIMV